MISKIFEMINMIKRRIKNGQGDQIVVIIKQKVSYTSNITPTAVNRKRGQILLQNVRIENL